VKKAVPTAPTGNAAPLVMPGPDLVEVALKQGAATIVFEMGEDNGPTAVGLLRHVAYSADGRIIKVMTESEGGLETQLIESVVGFRLIQGAYADKHYELRALECRRFLATPTTDLIKTASPKEEFLEMIARTGRAVAIDLSGQPEDDDGYKH
jgi:hypothetical protein